MQSIEGLISVDTQGVFECVQPLLNMVEEETQKFFAYMSRQDGTRLELLEVAPRVSLLGRYNVYPKVDTAKESVILNWNIRIRLDGEDPYQLNKSYIDGLVNLGMGGYTFKLNDLLSGYKPDHIVCQDSTNIFKAQYLCNLVKTVLQAVDRQVYDFFNRLSYSIEKNKKLNVIADVYSLVVAAEKYLNEAGVQIIDKPDRKVLDVSGTLKYMLSSYIQYSWDMLSENSAEQFSVIKPMIDLMGSVEAKIFDLDFKHAMSEFVTAFGSCIKKLEVGDDLLGFGPIMDAVYPFFKDNEEVFVYKDKEGYAFKTKVNITKTRKSKSKKNYGQEYYRTKTIDIWLFISKIRNTNDCKRTNSNTNMAKRAKTAKHIIGV